MRLLAIIMAVATAALYFLIGLGVLQIGTSTQGGGNDLLGFGTASGAAFLVVAALLALVHRRIVWILIAIFDLMVIVFYFVVAPIRQPPFEVWGLLIKVLELVLLVAVIYLIIRRRNGQRQPHRAAGAGPGP